MTDATRTSKELMQLATVVQPLDESRQVLQIGFLRPMTVKEMNKLHRQINECLAGNSSQPFDALPSYELRERASNDTAPGNAEIERLTREIAERDQSFELRWKADQRAIKRWQEAHPGNDLVWPDHADMCVWMLGEIERLRDALESLLPGLILDLRYADLDDDRDAMQSRIDTVTAALGNGQCPAHL